MESNLSKKAKKKKNKYRKKRLKSDVGIRKESGSSDPNLANCDRCSSSPIGAESECEWSSLNRAPHIPPIASRGSKSCPGIHNHAPQEMKSLSDSLSVTATGISVGNPSQSSSNVSLYYEETLNKSMGNLLVKQTSDTHISPIRRVTNDNLLNITKQSASAAKSKSLIKSNSIACIQKSQSASIVKKQSRHTQESEMLKEIVENNSLRWESELDNPEEEEIRIESYKHDRRKRYYDALSAKRRDSTHSRNFVMDNSYAHNSISSPVISVGLCSKSADNQIDEPIEQSMLSPFDLKVLTQSNQTLVYNC